MQLGDECKECDQKSDEQHMATNHRQRTGQKYGAKHTQQRNAKFKTYNAGRQRRMGNIETIQ